jgi:hypothetical protein
LFVISGRFASLQSGLAFIYKRNKSMTQKELNRSVAQATGESVRMIANLGFNLLDASPEYLGEIPAQSDREALVIEPVAES